MNKIRFSLIVVITTIIGISLASCEKEQLDAQTPVLGNKNSINSKSRHNKKSAYVGIIEKEVSPKFGKPNQTIYHFEVEIPFNPVGGVAVKLYEQATGNVLYLNMYKILGSYILDTYIEENGVYAYRYVNALTHEALSNSSSFKLTNSNVTFTRPNSHLVWPLGADGSSWNNRKNWHGSDEGSSSCGGYPPGQGTHTWQGFHADDSKAEDWNRCGGGDAGKSFRSPFDGIVRKAGWNPTGYGNCVLVEQTNQSGNIYLFRVAHFQSISVSEGQYVKAGITELGKIGNTGNSSGAHAHCVLYKLHNNGSYEGLGFDFSRNRTN